MRKFGSSVLGVYHSYFGLFVTSLLHTSTTNEMKLWQIHESEFTFTLEPLVTLAFPRLNTLKHSQW